MTDLLSSLSGALVGFILALVGGGGPVLAVPLLVYGVGVSSAHVAIGTSALANLVGHACGGTVQWCRGLIFAAADGRTGRASTSLPRFRRGHGSPWLPGPA